MIDNPSTGCIVADMAKVKIMTGKDLRALRHKMGLTIAQFAILLGYSWCQIQRLEVGGRNITPRFVEILRLKGLT